MGTLEKLFTGLTVVAVVSTAVASPYTANILSALFGGIGKAYNAAKH